MRRRFQATVFNAAVVLLPFVALSQSLTEKLSEQESFYKNYGREPYTKLKIERDVTGLYDLFGVHITDGVFMYDLRNQSLGLRTKDGNDSIAYSTSHEMQKRDMFEKFFNLVVTQDAIGGNKTAFMIGDQITTRFTPLTFNKTNFRGIRFDWWSTGLQFSALLSRTRPGFVSKQWTDGQSLVEYPTTRASFNEAHISQGLTGRSEYSTISPYGDIDWLIAVHAQNTIANKVDVGVTYINHHVTDLAQGEKWVRGNIPEGWMPSEIHFEFYDATPRNPDDPGVYVRDVKMFVNGQEAVSRHPIFRQTFVGSAYDSVLLPRELPMPRPQSGREPVIVAFQTNPEYYLVGGKRLASVKDIKEIKFQYKVAGNYLVFVSTSKQIPLAKKGVVDPQTKEITYEDAEKRIVDIYYGDRGRPINIKSSPADPWAESWFSTTYFGEYIAKSSRFISAGELSGKEFDALCLNPNNLDVPEARRKYNYRTHEYVYALNVSSVTYGLNVRGELGGVKFSGEVALNQKENKLPGPVGERNTVNRFVGTMKAERELGRNFGINGDLYFIGPEWETNLANMQASRYFKETRYKTQGAIPDYVAYPFPLSNNWTNIDDNDDNDAFVENDRRRYPSDLAAENQGAFHPDGAMRWENVKKLELPTEMFISCDDPDGVIASKDDRNRNGIPDYKEDFLLFASDPPQFQLGIDLNNNGIPDYEDDDILPDYGYSVGYFITANGIKTQGIGGSALNLRWTPMPTLKLDVGFRAESILDHDLDGLVDNLEDIGAEDRDFWEGKMLVGYITAEQEIVRRSQGIMYNIGAEVRGIRDAIRNDVVIGRGMNSDLGYQVDYSYRIDPLHFRKAAVGNLIGGVTYNNIRNFEYTFKAKLGAQRKFGMEQEFLTDYSFYDPVKKGMTYESRWETYKSRLIGDAHGVNKLSYKIGFRNEFDDWRRAFQFLNRLEINPQYKLGYSMSKEIWGPDTKDPRDYATHLRMDISGKDGYPDGQIDSLYDNVGDNLKHVTTARIRAQEYRLNNREEILNVPILRSTYRLAENTNIELGVQYLRYIDLVSLENNSRRLTTLAQLVSRYNYKGYNVTFFLGGKWFDYKYDILARDPVLSSGAQFDQKGYLFFAQLYSGI